MAHFFDIGDKSINLDHVREVEVANNGVLIRYSDGHCDRVDTSTPYDLATSIETASHPLVPATPGYTLLRFHFWAPEAGENLKIEADEVCRLTDRQPILAWRIDPRCGAQPFSFEMGSTWSETAILRPDGAVIELNCAQWESVNAWAKTVCIRWESWLKRQKPAAA